VQRLAQVVAGGRQKARLGTVGVGQRLRALFDLAFQGGVGPLQFAGHGVELAPELTDLVGTLDLNPVIQLPGTDARSACRERPDGPHHAPRKGDREAQGHDQADRGNPQRARQRAAPGFVGLALGQLDKHAPVHRWRGRLRHQDRLPLQADEPVQSLDRLRVDQPQDGREVGVAQHQAGIGVRDQATRLVDHVRLAVAADTQLRYDIADELQVHFCHHDTRLASRGG